uniref:Uncharacterized protein n=1 Tax=viral metagenome TaxID=1070528 RepID=A0A6C0CCQ4_9ZZZZ
MEHLVIYIFLHALIQYTFFSGSSDRIITRLVCVYIAYYFAEPIILSALTRIAKYLSTLFRLCIVFLLCVINIFGVIAIFSLKNYFLFVLALTNNLMLINFFCNDTIYFKYLKYANHRQLFYSLFSKINIISSAYCYFAADDDLWIQLCHMTHIICMITYYQYMCVSGALDFFIWCKDMDLKPYMQIYDRGDNKLYGDGTSVERFKVFMSKLTYIFWNDKLCIKCNNKKDDLDDFAVSFSSNYVRFKIDSFLLDSDKKNFVNKMFVINSSGAIFQKNIGKFSLFVGLRGDRPYKTYRLKMFLIECLKNVNFDVRTIIKRFFVSQCITHFFIDWISNP